LRQKHDLFRATNWFLHILCRYGTVVTSAEKKIGMRSVGEILREARTAAGLTTAEAAMLMHAARRTFEMWEAGERNMPLAKFQLFMEKIARHFENALDMVVVVGDDETPIDVVANDNFAGITILPGAMAEICSLAVNRRGRPYAHRTKFRIDRNQHVLDAAAKWHLVIED